MRDFISNFTPKALACFAITLIPSAAFAIDPIGANVNKPVACKAGGETFFPYGDTWAFLPGGACKGAMEGALGVQGTSGLADTDGHCMWVSFDDQGPAPKFGVTDLAAHRERARRTVFASMLKWASYKAGKATLGNPEWSCPTPSQTVTAPPTSYQTAQAYDFGIGNNSKVSFNFFRGLDVPAAVSGATNRGDESECFAPCKAGNNCASITDTTPGPSGATFYKCTTGFTDDAANRFRYKSVRHNVIFVRGAGAWKANTGQPKTVLASTEVTFWPDNGVIVTSDMLINNENIDWQFHNPDMPSDPSAGCDPNQLDGTSPNCFYLETVATHEAGHWMGLGHVSCADAVMVPTANSTDQKFDISKHEAAGICSVYRPTMEGRYPTKSRQGEGCFNDGQCNGETGLKCLFSSLSFYHDATSLATAPTAGKIPHRGVCVKASGCNADTDCDPTRGFVCQSVSESERYCMIGSPDRPRTLGSVSDFCVPCDDGTQCNGICASTASDGMNITLPNGTVPPPRMCTVRCEQASGCANGFTCQKVGSTSMCVPLNAEQCITTAANSRAQLNEKCGESVQCATGLECFSLNNDSVCLEKCSKTQACRTPGFGCLFQLAQDEMGKVVQLESGACFKKEMKEGDNCALGSSSLCGLVCSGTGAAEQCSPSANFGCYFDTRGAEYAQCYALCTTGTPPTACPGQQQTCNPLQGVVINMQPAGYCTPVNGGRCLKGTGEACSGNAECDTTLCLKFGEVSTCSNYCDLSNRSVCPDGTACTDVGGGKAACKPTGEPLKSTCGAASNGCQCGELSGASAFEIMLVAAALMLWRRRFRR